MNRTRAPIALAAAVLLALLAAAARPPGALAEGPADASLLMQPAAPAGKPNTYVIAAVLTDAQGAPLERQQIEFEMAVDFPGDEDTLTLGSKSTDATGRAAITFRPTWDGTHTITARSRPTAGLRSATAEMSFEVSGAAVPYVEDARGLEAVRERLPVAVGLMLATLWATLAFVLLRTVLGIARAGRRGAGAATNR